MSGNTVSENQKNIFPFSDITAPAPHRLVLPPLQNQWSRNARTFRPQKSLDLEGGALSPLASPKRSSPPPEGSRLQQRDKHGPSLQSSPAAANVDDLLQLQNDLKTISSKN